MPIEKVCIRSGPRGAPRRKEGRDKRRALRCTYPWDDPGVVIESRFGEQVDHAAASPGLDFKSTEYKAANAGMHDGASTHDTRLDGHVQIAIRHSVIAKLAAGFTQRRNLGMRCGIVAG